MASTVRYISLAPSEAFIGSDSSAAARRAASLWGASAASRAFTAAAMRSRIFNALMSPSCATIAASAQSE